MEFWPENQGQSPLYSKFGTVPGRNCTHNYHDKHQATHYPLYYGEQQNQSRESSYWTVPGSRTAGAPQEYSNWTNQELTGPASSHFPFVLDHHRHHHQDLGEYQPYEARDREWTAAQRVAREYERGFLREGWQRRWEPCSPVRYSREVCTKRNDSSYRELEAWAARYSHSLPRRRRIEAELRGASQGLLENSRAPERDSRAGTDPRVAALQRVIQSANIRESGMWDRGGRQQASTYYPPQTPSSDASHVLDVKEKTGYQRRMFSQPPGYIAPPPYNTPHKSSPVLHQSDTSWELDGKRQICWSQPRLREQDVSVELQDYRKGEREDFTKPDANQYIPEFEGLKHQRQETDANSPVSIQKPHIQHEGMLSLQKPQMPQAVQNKMINEEPTSKVIEGRKFRLNKKTGGMTIFCLVSRNAGTTETPSLPLCTSQANIQDKEYKEDSGDLNQAHKLADEVDFKAPALTQQPNASDAGNLKGQQKETPPCVESEMLKVNLSDKADTNVSPQKTSTNDADSTFGKEVAHSVQTASVKYPLWREPSFTSKAETESSSTYLKANSEEGESDVLHDEDVSPQVHPTDIEVRTLDTKKDTESEDSKGLLVIDTTCVVVKMELIPSPRKEHVHYLDSTPHTENSPLNAESPVSPECIQSNGQLSQDVTTDQNAETDPLQINEKPETELESDLIEDKAPGGESEIPFPCMSPPSVSERETLEERAERILGIPLHDRITEQQPEDAMSLLDSHVEYQDAELFPVTEKDTDDGAKEISEDTTEEEQLQIQAEVDQTEDVVLLQETLDAKDQVTNENGEDFPGSQDQVSTTETDSQLDTDFEALPETEMTGDLNLKSNSEDGTTEWSQKENPLVENNVSKYPTSISNLSNSFLLSPSLDREASNPALTLMFSSSDLASPLNISELNTAEGPDSELNTLNYTENLPLGSADFSPSPSHLDLTDQTAETGPNIEDQDEEGETSQLINNEISDSLESPDRDMTGQFDSKLQDNAACMTKSEETNKDTTDHIMEQTLKMSQENATEVNTVQQQLECVQAEDVVCIKESYMTEEQQPEEAKEDPTDQKQTPEISKEHALEVNSMQQHFESYVTKEQLPREASENPTGIFEQTQSQENMTESQSQTEVNILLQQFDNGQDEDASCIKEACMTEEQSQKEANEDPSGLLEQATSTENATGSLSLTEILQDTEPLTKPSISLPPSPSDSDFEAPQSHLSILTLFELPSPPHESHTPDKEFVSLLETDSVCPSAPDPVADAAPAAATSETVPTPLHLDSCEESIKFSSSSSSESPAVLLPSSSTPLPQKGSGRVSPDLSLKEEPLYPKSLWDAVNRIRKHTAPDSENEEEEVSELWDPVSAGEDLGCPDVVEDFEEIVYDEAGQQEVSTEGSGNVIEVGKIQQDPHHEKPSGHAEEDTLSCSSTSSHGSEDTVIVADEDSVEEMPPDAGTESKTAYEEGEQCCSGELKDETVAEEDDGDECVPNESIQSEECPLKVVNTRNEAVEITETKQTEDREEEVFMPPEVVVSDEGGTESESV
uniref:uncharacterized protein si:ch211-159e12.5 n=1 Tax=Scatophagus argus TaxID=75038 RepID=UPI001ED7DEEE|nr:uncharacterized protein si:ch211-159e12.5 [Scatophagus argus]